MKISTQDYGDVTVIELQGEFDLDAVGLFRSTFANVVGVPFTEETEIPKQKSKSPADSKKDKIAFANRIGIVLDMSDISFIDSEGLEQLLWARDYCHQNHCQLRLAGIDENCSKILEITRLEKDFDRYAELAEAVKSFA